MGYLFFKKKDFAKAGGHLVTASNLSPRNAQVLTLLVELASSGKTTRRRARRWNRRYCWISKIGCRMTCSRPLILRQGDYEKARDEAEVAIRKGKQAASPSQLILGESLLELGRHQEAVEALDRFLQESPHNPVADQVRTMRAEIQAGAVPPAESAPRSDVRLSEFNPLAALPVPSTVGQILATPGSGWIKPYVAPGVACPLAQVVDAAGERVTQLVQDVERFSAVEELLHQALDDYGIPTRIITRKYTLCCQHVRTAAWASLRR